MTQAQAEMAARASERAAIEGAHIIGHGTRKDGRRVFAVSSATEANRAHLVVVTGSRLVCDCQAAKNGRYCKHRSVVSARLMEEHSNRPINLFK